MIIESALRAVIIADAGVKAVTTRCYYNYIPQSPTYPLIVIQRVTGSRIHHLGGPSGAVRPRFQIEAWAETYSAAKGLANLIRAALDGKEYTEDTDGTAINRITEAGDTRITEAGDTLITEGIAEIIGVKFSCLSQAEIDGYEEAVNAHRIIQDYSVRYTE